MLVKNQADAKQNGIYKVVDAANRVWHRASDFDQNAEVTRFYRAFVSSGTANGGKTFLQETASVVLNTSNIVFSEVAANPAVRVATTANIGTGFSANQITGVALTTGALVIDGATLAVNDRVLVKNQTTALQNGIYTVTAISGTATLTRANDFDTSAEVVPGFQVFVLEGTPTRTAPLPRPPPASP